MLFWNRIALGAAVAACALTAIPTTASAEAANAERGKTLVRSCLVCHALPNAPVETPSFHPPKLAGQRAEVIYRALCDYKNGVRKSLLMRPVAAVLSEQDMRDLAAYLAAGGPHVPPQTVGQGTWAHEKVHRDCTACHGESGMGVMEGIPVLTGQNRDYLIHALTAYREGTRKNQTMAPIAGRLTPRQIELLADYFSMQNYLRLLQ
jgi:cytochrome c553